MSWSESGIYGAIFAASSLTGVVSTTFGWAASAGNYFFLTNTSDTPAFSGTAAAAGSSYAVTNEVSGTGWAAGGVVCSTAFSGASMSLAVASTTSGATVVSWTANNLIVPATTLASAYGGYFYSNTNSPKNKIAGIWFGGSPYSTTAGTFQITWSSGTIATFALAA